MIQVSFALTAALSVLAAEDPKLQVGVPLAGSISADAPSHPSPAGVDFRKSAPWPGVTLPLVIDRAGTYFLTLRSPDFDAYLVLKDADGKVIAEDDDGFFGTHARIETEALTPGSNYTLDALTPEGFGDFTLALDTTSPAMPSPEDALKIAQADLDRAEEHDDRPFQAAHADLAVAVAARAAGLPDDALLSANWAEQAYSEVLRASLPRRIEQSFAVFVKAGHPDNLGHATRVRIDIETHYNLGEQEGVIPLLEHLLDMMVRVVGEESGGTEAILLNLVGAHDDLGHYEEALRLNTRVLDLQVRHLGEDRPQTAATLSRLAATHFRLGHHDDAIRLGQRALEIQLRILGDDHADTALSLANLAVAHTELGHHDDAIRLGQRALDIRLRILGEDHADTALSLANLAVAHTELGHHDEAVRLDQRALDIRLRILGEDHADTALSLNNLAVDHAALGHHDDAIHLGQRALDIRLRILGEDHADTALTLVNLAGYHAALGDHDEALRLGQRALDIQLRILGEDHADTAQTLFNLASAHSAQGYYDEALRLGQRALDIQLRISGEDHADTVQILSNLAHAHSALGHHDEALRLGQRALDIQLRISGEDHADTAMPLANLAVLHHEFGHHDEALRLGQRALEIRLRVLGEDHADTAHSLASLGNAHSALGHHDEALRLGQRALEIRLRVLGEDHADTAHSLASLDNAHSALGHHDEALRLGQRALDIQLRILGEDHADTANFLASLAVDHAKLGHHYEAIRLGQRALEIQLRIQGPVGPHTTLTLMNLVKTMTEPGDQAALEALLVDHHRRCVEALGATDPRVAPSVARLAILRWRNNDRERALESLDAALHLGGWETAAADHGNENVLFELAEILRELDRIAGARRFAGYSVDLVLRFHPGDERVHQRRTFLADILLELGSFADAEKEYLLALDGYRETLGDDDPKTQYALFGLALAVQDQGRSPDAETHLRKLLAICERTLPKDHEFLQDVRLRLAEALRAQGKQDEADRVQETVTVATVYRPALLVNTPDRLETTTEQKSVQLDALITDYSGIADVKIVRDGFAISIRSLEEQAEQLGKYLTPDKTGQKATLHFPIHFQEGQSAIELVVSAQNRRGQWSDPQTFRIKYQPPQRDLYLLAFGVQDYDDDALDLTCPIADVDGIIAAMTAQEGGFFSRVHVKRLVDREVTSGGMKRAVDQFLTAAQPRDTIIVFAAGHGVRTEHSDYYFLTSNTTPANPYDGIDRPTIESLVTSDKLHAQRRLLLLDTCHAGGNAPGEPGARAGAIRTLVQQDEVNKFKAADESTGLYILASSSDDSFAREANGNGLFTRAFLDGLNGEADTGALGDQNGYVEIEELKNYIYFQVLETSQGKQRATVPKVIAGENFPIGRTLHGAMR